MRVARNHLGVDQFLAEEKIEKPESFGIGDGVNDPAAAKIDDRLLIVIVHLEGTAEFGLDYLDEKLGERVRDKVSMLFEVILGGHLGTRLGVDWKRERELC